MVDNYDSFTYNLVQMLEEAGGVSVDVKRNDAFSLSDVEAYDKVVLSPFAGPPANRAHDNRLPAGNVVALGRTLFSDYLLGIEMAGTLLLVATIGAIAITHRSLGRRVA